MATKQYTIYPYTVPYDSSTSTVGYSEVSNNFTMSFLQTTTLTTLSSLTIGFQAHYNQMAMPDDLDTIRNKENLFVIQITNTTEGTKTFQPNWTLNDFLGGTTGSTITSLKTKTISLGCQIAEEQAFSIIISVNTAYFDYEESGVARQGSFNLIYRKVPSASLNLAISQGLDPNARFMCPSCILANDNDILWSDFTVNYQAKWAIETFSGKRYKGPTPITGELPQDPWNAINLPQFPVCLDNEPTNNDFFFDWTRHEPDAPSPYNVPDIITESQEQKYSYYPINPYIWRMSLDYDTYHYQSGHWGQNPETHEEEWIIDDDLYVRKNLGYPWLFGYAEYVAPKSLFLYALFDFLFYDSNSHNRLEFDLSEQKYYTSTDDADQNRQWILPGSTINTYSWEDEEHNIVTGYTPKSKFPEPVEAIAYEYTGNSVITQANQWGIVNQNKQELYLAEQQ